MNSSSTELSQLLTATNSERFSLSLYVTPRHRPCSKHTEIFFTDPLPSNRRRIFALVGSRGNVFADALPNNGSVRHNMLVSNMDINNKTTKND
jgi:hypothetical protein